VNKADDSSRAQEAAEFYELGLGEPYTVSATNGTGIERLLDDAARGIECGRTSPAPGAAAFTIKVAIVGRPNVGKSSFVNAVFNEERVIVHDVPGTTRDAIDTDFEYKGRSYVLIDTAGIRHNTRLKEAADFFSGVRSREAIKRCDVAIVMIDGFDGMREDDKRVVEHVIEEGKALVLAVNKWDLSEGVESSKYKDMLVKSLNPVKNYPVIFTSCNTRRNVLACLDAAWTVYQRSKVSVAPAALKSILKDIANTTEVKTKRISLMYLRQDSAQPPTFVMGVRGGKAPDENIKRFIENFFRRTFDLEGVPVRISYDAAKRPPPPNRGGSLRGVSRYGKRGTGKR
jgi:GTP-binding protein